MVIDFELLHVTHVRYLRDHALWLRFNDGVEGVVDLATHLWGPVFEPLRDPEFFAQVRLEDSYTVAWPNGADLAPEFLYDQLLATGSEANRSLRQRFDDATARDAAQSARMPEISRFFGVIIKMFYKEHEAPHFHAQYGEYRASVGIRDAAVSSRRFPGRALRLVLDWRELHEQELVDNWERMRRGEVPHAVSPLE